MTSNFCPQCGTAIQAGVRFCPNCGQPTQPAPTPPQSFQRPVPSQYEGNAQGQYGSKPPGSDMATWSLVLGILSLLCIGMLGGIPGIIMGINAKNKLEATGHPTGTATAGIVTSIIGSIFWLIVGLAMLSEL